MTRKARLQAWAAQLNAPVPADANVAQLEQAIETAIAPQPEPQYSLRDVVVNNLAVIKAEAIPMAKAIASNLFG